MSRFGLRLQAGKVAASEGSGFFMPRLRTGHGEQPGRVGMFIGADFDPARHGPRVMTEPATRGEGGFRFWRDGVLRWPRGCFRPSVILEFFEAG